MATRWQHGTAPRCAQGPWSSPERLRPLARKRTDRWMRDDCQWGKRDMGHPSLGMGLSEVVAGSLSGMGTKEGSGVSVRCISHLLLSILPNLEAPWSPPLTSGPFILCHPERLSKPCLFSQSLVSNFSVLPHPKTPMWAPLFFLLFVSPVCRSVERDCFGFAHISLTPLVHVLLWLREPPAPSSLPRNYPVFSFPLSSSLSSYPLDPCRS